MSNRERDFLNHLIQEVRADLVDESRAVANTRFARADPGRNALKAAWDPELGHPLFNEAFREIRDSLIKKVPVTGLAYTIGGLTATFVEEFVAEAERARARIQDAYFQSSLANETGAEETFSQGAPLAVAGIAAIPHMVREGLQAVAEDVVREKISGWLARAAANQLVRPVRKALHAVGSVGAQLLANAAGTSSISTPVIESAARQLEVTLQEAVVTVYVKELVKERWEYAKVLAGILMQHPSQRDTIAEAFLRLPVSVRAECLPSMMEQFGFSQESVEDTDWLVLQFRKGWGSVRRRLLEPVDTATKDRMTQTVVRLKVTVHSRLNAIATLDHRTYPVDRAIYRTLEDIQKEARLLTR